MSAGSGITLFNALGDVTSANLIVVAMCEDVAPAGVVVNEFADGSAVGNPAKEHTVNRMGVDGKFVAGFVWRPNIVTLNLLPTSPFLEVVRECVGRQKAQIKPLAWDMEVTYPSIGYVYSFADGVLSKASILPAAGETLENVELIFTFGREDAQQL